jgi:cyclopropane fatty-acyl-phospholipid synthase-like methyltransferase
MSLRTTIAEQFRRPTGVFGRLVGRLMERGNRASYSQTLQHLDVRRESEVLEIGFGHGAGIAAVAKSVTKGRITGLDFSETMHARASARLSSLIRAGRVTLLCGDLATHDMGGATFDRIFAVNVVYFWQEPLVMLRRLRGLLRPNGILVLTFTTPERLHRLAFTRSAVFHAYAGDEVAGLLHAADFVRVEIIEKGGVVSALGRI